MLFTILFSLAAFAASPAFDLNDSAVLLPLPLTKLEASSLLKPAELLPMKYLDQQGRLVRKDENASLDLRVLAIRLDPCFQESGSCRRQIRLVWQPIERSAQGLTTVDAAAHSFYEFPDDREWTEIIAAWPRLTAELKGQPVQINPAIAREGLSGPTWTALRQLILKHCTERALTRVTVMQLPFTNFWVFRGIDITPSGPENLVIPRIDAPAQVFRVSLDPKKFEGGLEPRLSQTWWFWNLFLKDSDEIKVAGTIQEIADEIDGMANPLKSNTATLDCASCHVTQAARRWVEKDWRYPNYNVFPNRFEASSLNLENLSKSANSDRVRAFGYFGREAVVSQRTINETALAVEALNR